MHTTTLDTSRTRDSVAIVITDSYYSKPDSAGLQYITRVINTVQTKVSDKKSGVSVITEKKDSAEVSKTTLIQKKETLKTETKTSSFFKILGWCLGVGIVVIVILVLIRFKLIKLWQMNT